MFPMFPIFPTLLRVIFRPSRLQPGEVAYSRPFVAPAANGAAHLHVRSCFHSVDRPFLGSCRHLQNDDVARAAHFFSLSLPR
jgi:hypothetical protein